MSYLEHQTEVVELLCFSEELHGMMDVLIDMGHELPQMRECYRNNAYLIQGCISTSYFACFVDPSGRLRIEGDSNSAILKGVIYCFYHILDGESVGEVDISKVDWYQTIGLYSHLTVQRQGAVEQMLKRISNAISRND